jgi:50S ribosomal protein L16 3-hydroxylase
MLRQVAEAIARVQWSERDVAGFLGCYLSEPKPHIFFEPPKRPLSQERFAQACRSQGLTLDLKTQMLCWGNTVFVNGAAHPVRPRAYRELRELADSRSLAKDAPLAPETLEVLYQIYLDGYIAPTAKRARR